MNTLVIPYQFELFGEVWTVKMVKDLGMVDIACGRTTYDRLLIEIDANLPTDRKLSTFYHEVTHVILKATGQDKVNNDEKVVDLIGSCLHQILKSSVYPQ